MAHQSGIFDLGHHSMLRIIRSARSRMGRENSMDESSRGTASQTGAAKVAGDRPSKRTSLSRSSLGRHRFSRSSVGGQGSSENAAPEKPQQPPAVSAGILSDVTNIGVVPASGQASTGAVASKAKAALGGVPRNDAIYVQPSSSTGFSLSEADVQNMDDPQCVIEYLPDIMQNLQKEEKLHLPKPGYMESQPHVNSKMRGILMDWLVSVQQKYKLKAETFFLAVNLTDCYLELRATPRKHLQLVGITALLIAAKFEEIYPPRISDFVYVTDKAYTKEEILKMEVVILSALNFRICRPTAIHFLERYQRVNGCNAMHKDLAQYLLELTLVDYSMIKYSPSHAAAAAVFLSNKLLRHQPSWSSACAAQTDFTDQMLKGCAKEMCALLEHAESSSLQAVRKKFSQGKYNSVAKLSFTGAPPAEPTR